MRVHISNVLQHVNKKNPDSRHATVGLRSLIGSMHAYGFDSAFPIVRGVDGPIGDGHRRLFAAAAAGLTHVEVVSSNRESDDILSMNQHAKKFQAIDWLDCYMHDLSITKIPPGHARNIKYIEKHTSKQMLRTMLKRKQSQSMAGSIQTFIRRFVPDADPGQVIRWASSRVSSNSLTQSLRRASENRHVRKEMINAFNEDRDINKFI